MVNHGAMARSSSSVEWVFEKAWLRAGLAVAPFSLWLLPRQRAGVGLCPLHAVTGLPCPGCGMTRALAALVEGDVSAAWGWHPFGLVLFPVLWAGAVLAVLPEGTRARALGWLGERRRLIRWAVGMGLACFFVFGLARLALHLVRGERFP